MKTRLLAFVLLLTAPSLSAQRLYDDHAKIAAAMAEAKVPAVGVGIIRGGQLQQVKVYGDAAYDTQFNVASLTKPVVAMLTLKLVAASKWNLDEPLAKYWVDPDVANDPRHAKLTTRHVLDHRTGFLNWRFLEPSKKLAFHFEPGEKRQYSGEGFEYLRRALEKKFKQPLEQLAKTHLFDPLGMRDTRFSKPANAADDLLTTIEDYGRFASWVMQGTTKPLGWEVHENLDASGEYALIHSGSDEGVHAVAILLPKSGEGLIVFTTSSNGPRLYAALVTENLPLGKEIMARAK